MEYLLELSWRRSSTILKYVDPIFFWDILIIENENKEIKEFIAVFQMKLISLDRFCIKVD